MTSLQARSKARELLAVPITNAVKSNEIYSGIARHAGTLWCTRHRAYDGGLSSTVVVLVHPASNFMGHYALAPLAAEGLDAVGMTTRYLGNDSALLLENCVLDVASVISYLRGEGYRRVVLLGNSGGGSLACLYQSQAEAPTIRCAPGGGGPDLTAAKLPPVDALVLAMAHSGRAQLLTEWLDASVTDEALPFERDVALDIFSPTNGPPYSDDFLGRYREAQVARNDRISNWACDQLDQLSRCGVPDLPFVVHGVCADPRSLDLTVEPTDREAGTLWGQPWEANFQPASLGHYTTIRSWLSQWSQKYSNGYGPDHLRNVSVPVHVYYGTADQGCFPSHAQSLYNAVPHPRKALTAIAGGKHYLSDQPIQIAQFVSSVSRWLDAVL